METKLDKKKKTYISLKAINESLANNFTKSLKNGDISTIAKDAVDSTKKLYPISYKTWRIKSF